MLPSKFPYFQVVFCNLTLLMNKDSDFEVCVVTITCAVSISKLEGPEDKEISVEQVVTTLYLYFVNKN